LAAVQQLFEALGLTAAPRVELRVTEVDLVGSPGGKAQGRVVLATQEKRPIYAHAESDQAWLSVTGTQTQGDTVVIPLRVAQIPSCPGQTLHAQLSVQTNGKQFFKIPVSTPALEAA
jgi:hypothetical protein